MKATSNNNPHSSAPHLPKNYSTPHEAPVGARVKPFISAVIGSHKLIPDNGSTEDTVLVLVGFATANSVVKIFDSGVTKVAAPVGDEGLWIIEDVKFKGGEHVLVAKAVDGPEVSNPYSFTVNEVPVISSVAGASGPVPRFGRTVDKSLTLAGTAAPRSEVKFDDGGTFLNVRAAVSPEGLWSISNIHFDLGLHVIHALAVIEPPMQPSIPYAFIVIEGKSRVV